MTFVKVVMRIENNSDNEKKNTTLINGSKHAKATLNLSGVKCVECDIQPASNELYPSTILWTHVCL